jgi:hypothetical protein
MRESSREITRALFEENLTNKLSDELFRADISPLLRGDVVWDLEIAAKMVMSELVARLPGDPWNGTPGQ